jgi:GT2 family glycosyltransferase
MSALLILSDRDPADLDGSALLRSLFGQTDTGWTLHAGEDPPLARVLVDHDSTLVPDAIERLRAAFEQHADIQALITDAVVDGERRLRPVWSPTAAASCAEELDLVATRATPVGGSLAHRIAVLASHPLATIGHLPEALLHRTEPAAVTPDARRAIERLAADRRIRPTPTTASFLIPTAGTRGPHGERLVAGAISAARHAGFEEVEILVIVGEEFDGDPAELGADDVDIVHRPGPWNFSAAINTGLLAGRHDIVVLLNDDIEMQKAGWATPMVAHLTDPDVALVGAALHYPDGGIQHLGVVIDDAFPLHPYVGARPDELPARARSAHEVIAVTAACAVGRRGDLLRVGGLNENLPANFNDVDLCFKLQRTVGRIVLEPARPLTHHESASREPRIESWEWETFVGRWGEILDPWYHPGHHRPDDPADRRRNADGLPPDDPAGRWPLRTPIVRPSVHRARLAPPSSNEADR